MMKRRFLIIVVLFAFLTRIYHITEPKTYVFDEVYHALTSKLIARNDVRAYEWWNEPVEPHTAVDWLHPPLAKYTQAFGMLVFGENAFGWRISSVVFGVLVIAATAKLSDMLFHDKKISLFAAAFASVDGLLLVQSRTAMNDIHVTFFILLTLICYVRFRKDRSILWLFFTSICAGLAMASKWSGAYVLGGIFLAEVARFGYIFFRRRQTHQVDILRSLLLGGMFLVVIPSLLYVISYGHMFAQGKSLFCQGDAPLNGSCYCRMENSPWIEVMKKYTFTQSFAKVLAEKESRGGCARLVSHFTELHYQIFWYQTHLKETHAYQSKPLDWFLDLRPVWYYANSTEETSENIYAFGNPVIFWGGGLTAILFASYSLLRGIRRLLEKKESLQTNGFSSAILLLFFYVILWLPWQFSPRIMFFYHYAPAVPLLCILLAFGLLRASSYHPLRFLPHIVLGAAFCVFCVWYPHWIGLPVPSSFAQHVYFALPSWK